MAKQTEDTLVEAVVAKGRTVMFGDGAVSEGGKVSLPAAEVARLQSLGFLVNDQAEIPPANEGIVMTSSDGPSMQALS